MNLINWLRVLELNATATKSEVKSAYFRLCQIYHPDKTNNCPKAVQRFRTINEAYEALMKEPIDTSNAQSRNTETKEKYTEPKTRYSPFKAKYTPPKSKANNAKSKSSNDQFSDTKSKASPEQDEKQKQEQRFEQYVTNRLKKHIIFDSHVEEQIRECYRIRFLLINELNKNFEKKKTKEVKRDKKSKS